MSAKAACSPDPNENVVKPTMSVSSTVTCLRSASTQSPSPTHELLADWLAVTWTRFMRHEGSQVPRLNRVLPKPRSA